MWGKRLLLLAVFGSLATNMVLLGSHTSRGDSILVSSIVFLAISAASVLVTPEKGTQRAICWVAWLSGVVIFAILWRHYA
jgi:flagellar biosynthesis/type III secretory pathway M-ring protein FliF/YscJ